MYYPLTTKEIGMGLFREAFKKIGEGLKDASSLDVVTYTGSIETDLDATKMPQDFHQVLALAATNTSIRVKLIASTQSRLDGDILTYLDSGITPEEASAHNDLVELAQQNREAMVDFVLRVVGLDDID
jgi:hypothetical protein